MGRALGAVTFNARKGRGKVHEVRKSDRFPGYVIQNCDGRAVRGAVETDEPITCVRCAGHKHR